MRIVTGALLAIAVVTTAAAQAPEIPLTDTRLTVHTLLREDIFSGFLDDNTERMARGEKNLTQLLELRPDQRANLLAWKAGIAMQRAVRAHETGKPEEFTRYFKEARDTFANARQLSTGNDGVVPIVGGTYSVFADRLPKEQRADAWSEAYGAYSLLWKAQGANIEQMPVHFKGELLGGMAQSAQRTGRAEESAQFVDRMLTSLAGTPYEKAARQWKDDPASVATTNLTCKNCHSAGRLSARIAALNK
jgi:hypothetical protein